MFQMLLVGLAGENPSTQSNAIRALIFNMKSTIQFDSMLSKGRKPWMNKDDDNNQDDKEDKSVQEKLLSTDPSL